MTVQLLPPRVVLPLTACSTEVRLQGLVPGTTVRVTANGRSVAQGPATSSEQSFTLSSALQAGEIVRGKQDFPTEGSDPTPDGVKVLRGATSGAELGALNAVSHIYQCGRCLWVDGAFPGATVEVRAGGQVRGLATSNDGNARMSLSPRTAPGEVLEAQQTACGFAGPITFLPAADPLPTDPSLHVPPARLLGPLVECQQQVGVEQILDGGTITIHRDLGDEFACCDRSSTRINLVNPLKLGEKLQVSQAFLECEVTSDRSRPPIEVGPPNLAPPFLHPPICNRDRTVRVSGLMPGATVMFMLGDSGNDFAYGTAWDSTCDFQMPDLFGVMSLKVKQGICQPLDWSDASNTVKIDTQPAQGDLFLRISGPLFECGRLVHVTGAAPGTTVFLISKKWNGPIGWSYAPDFELDIAVMPLTPDDEIRATANLCGDPFASEAELVRRLAGDLVPPHVADPVHDCGGTVRVIGVVPGASVDVYVNGVFAGSARASFSSVNVPIAKRLVNGDRVAARQSLCTRTTRLSNEVMYHADHEVELVALPGGQISERVCQLTGERDPEPAHAHLNDTTQWGVFGTDLGINFHHAGRHYFFFGDEGIDESDDQTRDADPMFFTTDLQAEPSGFHMQPILSSGSNRFRRLAINGASDLANFEVPTGGFSYNGKIYLFIARRNPRPMQISLLASAVDPHNAFDLLFQVDTDPVGGESSGPNPAPSKFINISSTVVQNVDWKDLPSQAGDGLVLYGSGWYRRSGVCLAWAPLTPGTDPSPPASWRFFDPTSSSWSNPGDLSFAKPFAGPANVGEFSVTWIPVLRRWLMLCEQDIVRAHVAKQPTGPWTQINPEVFNKVRDGALGKWVHNPGQDNLADREAFANQQGGSYGPYLVDRFTRWNSWTRTATLYYVISTHVPYQVMLMKFRLRCA